jgi:hypothetical protein
MPVGRTDEPARLRAPYLGHNPLNIAVRAVGPPDMRFSRQYAAELFLVAQILEIVALKSW